MRLFEWLGLETRSESDDTAHAFAMRRTGGDPRWLHAMGVFKEFNRQDVHAKAVKDGVVTELYPRDIEPGNQLAAQTPELRPQHSHVRVVLTDAVEVTPVTFFDQDKEVI